MQLVIVSLMLFFLVISQEAKAQFGKINFNKLNNLFKSDTTEIDVNTYQRPDWQAIDIDFLSSYYMQDGNNSPVTGGIGTEQLTDFTQKIIVSVPLSQKLRLNLDGGYDYYSSASTDNIDNVRSSDSSSDMRIHGNVGVSYQLDDTKSISFRVGGSKEYDYFSGNGGVTFNILSKDKNTSFGVGVQAFIDKWKTYYPSELRGEVSLPTTNRQSYNGSLSFSRVLNKRMQMSVQVEGIYMNGLLSTPFHRVYFQEQNTPDIERLPSSRFKVPIGVRLNTHLTDWLVSRMYYRFYWDNWGIQAHTASIELPFKLNRFLSIYPFYRFHTQTGADYFQPYKQHSIQDTYYSSDYDLSALSSHTYGLGLSYSPANGLAKINLPFKKRPVFMVKSIDLKYSRYQRSTGLQGDLISLGLKFSF